MKQETRGFKDKLIHSFKHYKEGFKKSLKVDSFKPHIFKVGLTYVISLLVVTISFSFIGVILFIFI